MHLYIINKELLYTVVEPSFLNSSDCVIKVHRRYYVDALQNRIWSGIAGVGVQVVWGPRLGEEGGGQLRGFTVSESSCKIFYSLTTKIY